MNIHVGHLAREVTEPELRQVFEPFGLVESVRIVTDRHSGVSRGFGFVHMPDNSQALAAIENLNLKEFAGRTMDLSESHDTRGGRSSSRAHGSAGRNRPGNVRKRGPSGGKRQRF